MKKKIFLKLIILFLIFSACPLAGVLAKNLGNYGSDMDLATTLDSIETIIWIVFSTIALVFFVMAGVSFLSSQGVPDKLATARSSVLWGVVGIIVGIIAYSIVAILEVALTQ